MDRAGMQALSEQFRLKMGALSTFQRNTLEQTMQTAFNVRNLRNVQLWTREGETRRNFINSSLSSSDLDMRIAFARAVIEERTPGFPTKIQEFEDFPNKNGEKLREYLANNYTRSALSRILISPDGTIGFEYDSYGQGYSDDFIDEDDLEEFR